MNKNLLTRPAQAFYCLFPKTFTINFCTTQAKTMRGKTKTAALHIVKLKMNLSRFLSSRGEKMEAGDWLKGSFDDLSVNLEGPIYDIV